MLAPTMPGVSTPFRSMVAPRVLAVHFIPDGSTVACSHDLRWPIQLASLSNGSVMYVISYSESPTCFHAPWPGVSNGWRLPARMNAPPGLNVTSVAFAGEPGAALVTSQL